MSITTGAGLTEADSSRLAAHVVRKYEQGMSIRQLTQDTGHSYSAIRRTLTEAGVTLRPWGGARPGQSTTSRREGPAVTTAAPRDAANPTTRRAVVIVESLWPDFTHWCKHHRITLQALPHSPGQMPRFETHRPATMPPGKPPPRQGPRSKDALSHRELEVLQLMADGLKNHQIGGKLHLSEDTIKSHARRIYRKLHVPDRSAAVATALRNGLVE